MRPIPFILCFFAASLCLMQAQEEVDEAAVIELRETISKLVDVQTLESKERLEWQARKAELGNLLALHQKELKLLEEELAKAGKTAPAHEEQTDEIQAEIAALKEARQVAAEAVARNQPRLLALSKRLPAPLQLDAGVDLATISAWQPGDEPREALQAMLAFLDKSEQFNRRFTRGVEVRDGSEVEVLYLGLAQAYYLSRKGKAGVGRPGPEGWRWQSKPEVRDALEEAFAIMDQKLPPASVTFPLQLD